MNSNLQILAFELNERRYGLRLAQVERVIRAVDITPLPRAPQIVWGAIDLHGDIIPVLSTRKCLGFADREIDPDDEFIIARAARQNVALVVDSTLGIIERRAEEIFAARNVLPQLQKVEGIVRLDDDLLLIHDLDLFLSLDERRELQAVLTEGRGHGN